MSVLKITSPVDGSVFAERELSTAQDINNAILKSVDAGRTWSKQSLASRISLLSRALDIFVQQTDEIAREITLQIGRPLAFSPGEVRGVEERGRYMLECAEAALSPHCPAAKEGFSRFITREPLGIVLVIAPWNYPFLTAINCIIPALAAGNTVLLKHSSQTPLCAERMQQVFLEAGLPEGVFQYLHLSHPDTEKLIQAPEIDFVNFTGSVPAGKQVQQAARHRFIDVGLELGGKDPAWVRDDVNLKCAIEQLVDGSFFNSGQSCCGIERIYVHKNIYRDFVDGFVEYARGYQLGNPFDIKTTLGPMIKSSAADFVREQIHEAVLQGAESLINEDDFSFSKGDTTYLAPQVLVNVNHNMRVMTEESFGPVVGIMPADSDEDAIRLMNDSEFGLSASIWTADEMAALQIGSALETGTVFMNRCDYLDPALVWTGVKDTGRGKSLSVYGYDAVTRLKSYHFRQEPES